MPTAKKGTSSQAAVPSHGAKQGAGSKVRKFYFDAALDATATQGDAFRAIGARAVTEVLAGLNAVTMAYGHTGTLRRLWRCYKALALTRCHARTRLLCPTAPNPTLQVLARHTPCLVQTWT